MFFLISYFSGLLFYSFADYVIIAFVSHSIKILEWDRKYSKFKQIAAYRQGFFDRIRNRDPPTIASIQQRFFITQMGEEVLVFKTKTMQTTLAICSSWRLNLPNAKVRQIVCSTDQNDHPVLVSLEIDTNGVSTLNFYQLNIEEERFEHSKLIEFDDIYLIMPAYRGVVLLNCKKISYKNLESDIVIECPIQQGDRVKIIDFRIFNLHTTFLLSSQGIIFKLSLDIGGNDDVTKISFNLFDEVPISNRFCIVNSKYMLVLCDFGS